MAADWRIISLRKYRKWHRFVGLFLTLFLVISSVTGILLALKKEVSWIQPPTQKQADVPLADWLPVDQLHDIALQALHQHQPAQADNAVDRLDVRPDKGIVKVLFKQHQWEVQLAGQTGAVLSVARRHSDWIEQLHDGSIISDSFKMVSMHVLGLGLLLMITTGFWLWYGPRLLRERKKRH